MNNYIVVEVQWWEDDFPGFIVMPWGVWKRHYEKKCLLVTGGLTEPEALALARLLNAGERDEP